MDLQKFLFEERGHSACVVVGLEVSLVVALFPGDADLLWAFHCVVYLLERKEGGVKKTVLERRDGIGDECGFKVELEGKRGMVSWLWLRLAVGCKCMSEWFSDFVVMLGKALGCRRVGIW